MPGGAVEPKSGAREMALKEFPSNDYIVREELDIIFFFKRHIE